MVVGPKADPHLTGIFPKLFDGGEIFQIDVVVKGNFSVITKDQIGMTSVFGFFPRNSCEMRRKKFLKQGRLP